jgi:hypothetical protein
MQCEPKSRLHPFRLGMHGILHKQTRATKKWREKYFTLEKRRIKCYDDNTMAVLHGELIADNELQVYDVPDGTLNRSFVFYIIGSNASKIQDAIILAASNEQDKQNWMEAIGDCVNNGFKRIFQPDIWSSAFYPSVEMIISYRNKIAVENGNFIRPIFTEDIPTVMELEGVKEEDAFTLLLLDIDPPMESNFDITKATSEINAKEAIVYLHWAIVNAIGPHMHSYKEVNFISNIFFQYFIIIIFIFQIFFK